MECPNCKRNNPDGALACESCSVIFAKFTARQRKTDPGVRPEDSTTPAAPPNQSSSWNILWLFVGLAVLAGGGWYLHQQKLEREDSAKAAPQSPPAAPAKGLRERVVDSAKTMAGATQRARDAAKAMSAAGERSRQEAERGLAPNR